MSADRAREWTEAEIYLANRSAPIRDVMRFTLVYHGPLSASGNKPKLAEVTAIREHLSPQFAHLWDTHAALQALKHDAWVDPRQAGPGFDNHPSGTIALGGRSLTPAERAKMVPGMVNLAGPMPMEDCEYTPLVRKTLRLACELDVLFLRQDDPGALVTQGGELDNRIKTLVDALRMPSVDEHKKCPPKERSIYCLMQSDTLVSALNVDTDRLLFPRSKFPNEVFLVVEVSIRVLKVERTNVCLL